MDIDKWVVGTAPPAPAACYLFCQMSSPLRGETILGPRFHISRRRRRRRGDVHGELMNGLISSLCRIEEEKEVVPVDGQVHS